ncbi:MAG: hypothetical protein QOG62_1840 [Thermoleophilaceae bacterium]|nr:hypothetical protein [Thermoleophilaceae bacterium]
MRAAIVAGITATLLLAMAGVARAAITVGQAPPLEGSPIQTCSANTDQVNTHVSSGPSYTVPGPGVITGWQAFGSGPFDIGDAYAMRVFTQGDATHLTPVFDSGERIVAAGLNTYPERFPVRGGELIGVRIPVGPAPDCGTETVDSSGLIAVSPPLGTSTLYTPTTVYRYDVAAIIEPDADGDGYGDETQDGCPSTPGACVPATAIGKLHPPKRTTARKAKFSFSADDRKVTFQCKLDKGAFTPCVSPVSYKKLKPRKHTFQVQATANNGTAGTVDTLKWRVTGG